jgi:hypothetical protein
VTTTRDVRKVHILLHFLLYNNTYVVQMLSAKIYISRENIYKKLLNCILHFYFNNIYIQNIYTIMEHFDNVNSVKLTSCIPAIQFLPSSTVVVPVWRILNTCYVPFTLWISYLKLLFKNKNVTGSHTGCEKSVFFKGCGVYWYSNLRCFAHATFGRLERFLYDILSSPLLNLVWHLNTFRHNHFMVGFVLKVKIKISVSAILALL